jgi:hypothetical protein
MVANIWIGYDMPAPLVGAAALAAAAAKLAAKKLAKDAAKKTAAKATVKKLSPSAEKSIAEARKALGSSKPDPKALARRITQDKAREMERIRKQGRNTR